MTTNSKKGPLNWWKILTIILLFYTLIAGFLFPVPRLPILNESIRNLYFHVPMWFAMIIMLGVSVVNAILYLSKEDWKHDKTAVEAANTGIVFGVLGIVTGMLWAKFTWGEPWSGDPKQNASAIGILIYLAYFILRGSFSDPVEKAKISAIYNILAYPAFLALIFVLPRLTSSLHPGNGGNPGFNAYDLDNKMRLVFYPAIIGFSLLGWWITTLRIRFKNIEHLIKWGN